MADGSMESASKPFARFATTVESGRDCALTRVGTHHGVTAIAA
jgi:hypothetical protein